MKNSFVEKGHPRRSAGIAKSQPHARSGTGKKIIQSNLFLYMINTPTKLPNDHSIQLYSNQYLLEPFPITGHFS